MLNHYLLLIYRNFIRAKSYFMINLIGLSTGLACTLFIFVWVRDEFRINTFHAKDARLFQVMQHKQYASEIMTTTSPPGILAETCRREFPEVQFAATTTCIDEYTFSVHERHAEAERDE